MAKNDTTDGEGFSDFEKQAMKERAAELRASKGLKGSAKAEKDRKALEDRIASMAEPDRKLAERLYAIISEVAPELEPKTWYSMAAWAKNGKILVHFQDAAKFETRYATIGFSDVSELDTPPLWPVGYGITEITDEVAAQLGELIRRAAG